MAAPSRLYTFTPNTTIASSQVNGELNQIIAALAQINTTGTFRDCIFGTGVILGRLYSTAASVRIAVNCSLSGSTWTADSAGSSAFMLEFDTNANKLILYQKDTPAASWESFDYNVEIIDTNQRTILIELLLSKKTSTNDTVIASRLSSDTGNRFHINAGGKHEWGDGSSPVDADLLRISAGTLKTNVNFVVGNNLTVDGTSGINLTSAGADKFTHTAATKTVTLGAGAFRPRSINPAGVDDRMVFVATPTYGWADASLVLPVGSVITKLEVYGLAANTSTVDIEVAYITNTGAKVQVTNAAVQLSSGDTYKASSALNHTVTQDAYIVNAECAEISGNTSEFYKVIVTYTTTNLKQTI